MRKYLTPNVLFVFAVIIFFFFLIQIIFQTGLGIVIDFREAGLFATALSGIFSFISVLLIYKTLTQQTDTFNQTQFENRLFEMIRIHRSNITTLKMRSPDTRDDKTVEGYKVVREINKQVMDVIKLIDPHFSTKSPSDIYLNSIVKEKDSCNPNLVERKIDLIKFNKISIAYLCVFFGVGEEGRHTLEQIFKVKYKSEFYEPILNALEKIKAKWDTKKTGYVKYYGGHQYRLGHLFRHLYHVVNYINDNKNITYAQKYEYVRLVRAQLSSYEQSLVFFNSLSNLGLTWELNIEVPEIVSSKLNPKKLEEYKIQKMLITKYNFIRNTPNEFVVPVSIKEFYPNIVFDGEDKTEKRKELENVYNKD